MSKSTKNSNKSDTIDINIADLEEDHRPIVFKMAETDHVDSNDDIFNYPSDPQLSVNIDYPKFSLGFHHFIHQSKDKMEITKDFEGKKKVYHIFNRFERYIDDYDSAIGDKAIAYFGLDPNTKLTNSFFKLWELLIMHRLVSEKNNSLNVAMYGHDLQTGINAIKFFVRSMNVKNDKYYAYTTGREVVASQKNVFVFTGKQTEKSKMNLIIANLKFTEANKNVQEQAAFYQILEAFLNTLQTQEVGGNFVCKLYETFTMSTVKLLYLINTFYNECYITKPLTSKKSNSEKFFICLGFKAQKDLAKRIKVIESINRVAMDNENRFIVNIFPEFLLPVEYYVKIIKLNTTIGNKQFTNINDMVEFIQKQNYRGDVYENRRRMQIESSDYWTTNMFPSEKDFIARKNQMEQLTKALVNFNDSQIERLGKKLTI